MKSLVRGSFDLAFGSLDVSFKLLASAYSLVSKSGEGALTAVHHQVGLLRKAVNDAIDSLGD